ncbi:MAG: DUF2752 domain-containing protein [Bacteroidales bacterium]|nr:DUF2752 domain-containing protein [Bacteroidales bacterium]
MLKITDWLEHHLLPCAYKQIFGFDCPACGFQRALIELLKGNIKDSLLEYPGLIPTVVLVGVFIFHLFRKTGKSRKVLLIIAKTDLVIIIVSYIIRLVFY